MKNFGTVSSRSRLVCFEFTQSRLGLVSLKKSASTFSRSRSRTEFSLVLFLGLGLVTKNWSCPALLSQQEEEQQQQEEQQEEQGVV